MSHCPFCDIIKGKLPAKKLYEDEKALAFEDINPQAPVHIVVIPKKHITSLNELSPEECSLVGYLLLICSKIARQKGVAEKGYRVVTNCGYEAGQSINHLHFHLLAGRQMDWPPG